MLLLSSKKEITAKEVNKALIALQKDIKNNSSSTTVVQNVNGGGEPIDTYTKTEIDNKDTAVLQEAENYTYSKAETNTLLAEKSDVGHTHEIGDVNGLQASLNSKASSIRLSGASNATVVLGSDAGEIGRVTVNDVAHASDSDSTSYVKDYNNSSRPIYIGYEGAGATASEVSYLCAYKDANHLKDMSKAEVKKWLGGSLLYFNPSVTISNRGGVDFSKAELGLENGHVYRMTVTDEYMNTSNHNAIIYIKVCDNTTAQLQNITSVAIQPSVGTTVRLSPITADIINLNLTDAFGTVTATVTVSITEI